MEDQPGNLCGMQCASQSYAVTKDQKGTPTPRLMMYLASLFLTCLPRVLTDVAVEFTAGCAPRLPVAVLDRADDCLNGESAVLVPISFCSHRLSMQPIPQ